MGNFLVYTIFGSFVWFCIILGIFIISCFCAESYKQGQFAFTAFVAFLVINHFWGNIPVIKFVTWLNALVYFGIGFLFAVLRSYFKGREARKYKYTYSDYKLSGHVFRWWLMWPISLIHWTLSDLIKNAWDFIYEKCGHIFESFYKLGAGPEPKKEQK